MCGQGPAVRRTPSHPATHNQHQRSPPTHPPTQIVQHAAANVKLLDQHVERVGVLHGMDSKCGHTAGMGAVCCGVLQCAWQQARPTWLCGRTLPTAAPPSAACPPWRSPQCPLPTPASAAPPYNQHTPPRTHIHPHRHPLPHTHKMPTCTPQCPSESVSSPYLLGMLLRRVRLTCILIPSTVTEAASARAGAGGALCGVYCVVYRWVAKAQEVLLLPLLAAIASGPARSQQTAEARAGTAENDRRAGRRAHSADVASGRARQGQHHTGGLRTSPCSAPAARSPTHHHRPIDPSATNLPSTHPHRPIHHPPLMRMPLSAFTVPMLRAQQSYTSLNSMAFQPRSCKSGGAAGPGGAARRSA